MMILVRKGNARGNTQTNWLDSLHTFSFADYYYPDFMGFSTLRVINEDIVQPAMGFASHYHRDMEIISYINEGALEHKDSMGNGSIIHPGEVQCMSAGSGIKHSEFNHSTKDVVHFLQIWILPDKKSLNPSYQQQRIPQSDNEFILIASGDEHGLVKINQDMKLYLSHLFSSHSLHYNFSENRCGWLQMVKGSLAINNQPFAAGDGAAILEKHIEIKAMSDSEFLLFDLIKP